MVLNCNYAWPFECLHKASSLGNLKCVPIDISIIDKGVLDECADNSTNYGKEQVSGRISLSIDSIGPV